MHTKEWLKSAGVAVGGGAAAALSAAMMDHTKFNLSNGIGDELLIALQGALVGLAALFVRSPLGTSLMAGMAEAKQQAQDDRKILENINKDKPK